MSHDRLSPSGFAMAMLCPGRPRETAKYPDSDNFAAIDGTHTHTGLEHCLKDGKVADPMKMTGIKLLDDYDTFVMDKERCERIKVATDYIAARVKELHPCIIKSEWKVNPGELLGRDDMKGTTDVALVSNDVLEIIDYKDGMNPVNAFENVQMSLYALGVLREYWTPMGYPFKKIVMTIIQPKMGFKSLPMVSSWVISQDELLSLIPKYKAAAEATDDPNAPLIPGNKQCQWCSAKGNCTTFINWSMSNMGVEFSNLSEQAANKEPDELSDEQIREIVESAPTIRAMLEAVEKEAMRRFESGRHIDGLKVIRGNGRRAWNLSDDDIADKLKKMGIPKTVIWKQSLISPAQVEKLKWENKNGVHKSLSERQIKTLNTEYIKKSEGSLKVVSESQSGQAVTFDVSDLFQNIESVGLPDWMQ